MLLPKLSHLTTVDLRYPGDCSLLGVSPDLTLYIEESYTEDCWIAQHAIRHDGVLLHTMDEQYGRSAGAARLPLPTSLATPDHRHATLPRSFSGPRQRGLREPERIADTVKPLTISDKMRLAALAAHYGLVLPAPLILGIAQQVALAQAPLAAGMALVCWQIRVAYALTTPQHDDQGAPYDYDTLVYHAAQLYDPQADTDDLPLPGLTSALAAPGDASVLRPMDCLLAYGHLFIADGGRATASDPRVSRVHRWQVTAAAAE